MSTTRPEASVITGTVRAMSGSTTPVATSSDGASYRVAVTSGYCSGFGTEKRVTSTPGMTCWGGGASCAATSPCSFSATAEGQQGRQGNGEKSKLQIFSFHKHNV